MFQELEAARPIDPQAGRWASEQTLASILAEFEAANVLMTAGQATGEAGTPPEPQLLEEALHRLDRTANSLERTGVGTAGGGAVPGQFGFAEAVEQPEIPASADVPSAVATFLDRCDATLDALVVAAQGALAGIFKRLGELDGSKVLETIERLGHQVAQVSGPVGRLLRKGVQLLGDAFAGLVRLLGQDALTWARDRVRKLWQDVKDGKQVTEALGWAFDVEATRRRTRAIADLDGLDRAALDRASRDLDRLAGSFRGDMDLAGQMGSAVALGGVLASRTPWAGPLLTIVAASYTTIVAGVVLRGMDYADSETVLRRIPGVGEIAEKVRPAPAAGGA